MMRVRFFSPQYANTMQVRFFGLWFISPTEVRFLSLFFFDKGYSSSFLKSLVNIYDGSSLLKSFVCQSQQKHKITDSLFLINFSQLTAKTRERTAELHETSTESKSLRQQIAALKISRDEAIAENG